MAIDTRNKRASALGRALPFTTVFPEPDGTIGADDRAHVSWLYAGLDYTTQATGVPTIYCTPMILDFALPDMELDFNVAPMQLAFGEPVILNFHNSAIELDFHVPAMEIDCEL